MSVPPLTKTISQSSFAESLRDLSSDEDLINKRIGSPNRDHRRRRSSSILSHVEPETFEDENDQHILTNMNATWMDQPGAWIIHVVIILLLAGMYKVMPGMSTKNAWSLTNTTYVVGSYVMFHWIKGTPFEFNGGAYDNLTMWEQIDGETLFTPTRKYLISVPIVLFLIVTHYSRGSHFFSKDFIWNCCVTFFGAILPKLPITHRLRLSIPGFTPAQIS
ncbi:Protein ORM1 [Nakaseomyces glabratus]|uniref:Protein ORM1 n=1 Tax=Candida glabrata TaxID=5478 RepID=A0A0W0D7E9_CANGB|nr:ORMDL family [Nakaseomyces glabratus]KAH7602166.1 ORMDL family [Nakaseomyces glabratus]KAH7613556.1 ORMDL family [Nakaseomyces glabratus]KAI8387100.1 ORMDL family [Nakaseomyces glabratus]KTA95273.1 Protein ORM1 [Nakaseomyces glabratus]